MSAVPAGRPKRTAWGPVLLLLVGLLTAAPSGAAASSFVVGTGRLADVAMAPDGSFAVMSWNGVEPNSPSLHV